MKLIVISFDAVGAKDLEFLMRQESFGRFFEEAAYSTDVKSVYPSVTYPAHTSIVTGRLPNNHGVVNNTLVQRNRVDKPDWMWQRKYVKSTTLYDEYLKKGKTVASIFWPVTAKSKITYSLPEVLPNRPWQNQISVSLANGSPLFEIELFLKYGKLLDGTAQPALDNFAFASALYTLEKYSPDLMLIHLTDVDTNRHLYGLEGEETDSALLRHADRLSSIDDTLKRMGIYEDTTVVILGDHYQKNTVNICYPNYFLKKAGLDKKAFCHEADGSAYVYVDSVCDVPAVKKVFYSLLNEKTVGIKQIYSKEEAIAAGADKKCAFVLEADDGWYFQDQSEVPTESVDESKQKHIMRATHGYHPNDEAYKTFFAIRGATVKKNYDIGSMSLVDEGPTLAKILGVSLGNCDGRCLEEIFI